MKAKIINTAVASKETADDDFLALFTLSSSQNIYVLSAGLFFFGVVFIFLQSTLVSAVQEMLPNAKGTAMSVASFNIFVGGAIGTGINARIIEAYSVSRIYLIAAFLILITGLASSISKSEKYRKN